MVGAEGMRLEREWMVVFERWMRCFRVDNVVWRSVGWLGRLVRAVW